MTFTNTIGTLRVASRTGRAANPEMAKMASGWRATSSAAYRRALLRSPAAHRGSILIFRPSVQPSSASPCRKADKRAWPSASSGGEIHKGADEAHRLGRLSTRSKRPPHRRAAEHGYELATSFHSITSSASESSIGGTSRPRVLAVLRLIARSYLVGAWTGRSAGFSPLRIRST